MDLQFRRRPLFCAVAMLSFGSGFAHAAPLLYSVNGGPYGINNGTITGTIETDGTIGTLSASNFVTWNLLLSDGLGHSFTLNPGNSVVTITGTATTATANSLQFNYDTPNDGALGYFEIMDTSTGWGWQLSVPPNQPLGGLVNPNNAFDAGLLSFSPQPITIATITSQATALSFVPVAPCRAVDTRTAAGPLSGPSIAGGTSRSFAIAGNACGIPSGAAAYSLNAAIVPTSNGYMTMWPTGQPQPTTASVNSPDGGVHSNGAIVPAGANGAISIYAFDTMDVVLDVNGYFVPTALNPSALAFYPVTPCRVADTRNADGDLGGPFLSGGSARTFPILEAAGACNLSTSAQAWSLNLAVVPHGEFHYLTAWAAGQSQPDIASLNDPQSVNHSNAAIVPAAAGTGAIELYATNDTDVVIDIDGYFAPPGTGGLSLYTLQPCRVLDTRNPSGSPPFTGTIAVDVVDSGCGAPSRRPSRMSSMPRSCRRIRTGT